MTKLETATNYEDYIRTVEFRGVNFYDISPVLGNVAALGSLIKEMAEPLQDVDKLIGLDARGFLFLTPLALELGVGCAMLRKAGKLPGETVQQSYSLEYGTDVLEIQADAIQPGENVALVDDLIATGGTVLAGIELVRSRGGNVTHVSTVIDLPELGGSQKIREAGVDVRTIMELGI